MASNQRSTRQLLVKIPNYPCLYRHSVSGNYYGIKKFSGKRKEHSLDTDDRKVAERKLKEWLKDLDKTDAKANKTELSELLEKLDALHRGKSEKTKATNKSILNIFKTTWKQGLDIRVSEIKPSHLNEWLAQHEARIKNTTYNRYATLLKQLFEIAVNDRMISESPFQRAQTKWKKPQKPIRNVPTLDQLGAIVKDIREQKYNADAEEAKPAALHVGGVVHQILNNWNMARWKKGEASIPALKEQFEQHWENEQKEEPVKWDPDEEPQERASSWSLLETYLNNSPIPPNEKPEAVEVSLQADLAKHGLPVLHRIIDLVRKGRRIVEFKTAGQTTGTDHRGVNRQ